MKYYEELEERLIKTSTKKGIFTESSAYNQALYTQSELDELKQSLTAYENGLEYYINSKGETVNTIEQIKDDYGDMLVTIGNGIQFFADKFGFLEAFEHSLVIFENRKGKMIKGAFVKEAEEEKELFTFTDKHGLDKKFEAGETIWQSGNIKGSLKGYTNGVIEDFLLNSEVIKLKK